MHEPRYLAAEHGLLYLAADRQPLAEALLGDVQIRVNILQLLRQRRLRAPIAPDGGVEHCGERLDLRADLLVICQSRLPVDYLKRVIQEMRVYLRLQRLIAAFEFDVTAKGSASRYLYTRRPSPSFRPRPPCARTCRSTRSSRPPRRGAGSPRQFQARPAP